MPFWYKKDILVRFYCFSVLNIKNMFCFTGNYQLFQVKTLLWYKKDFFYIPRFVRLIKKITVYSAARVATFTGIYQGSRLRWAQGQLRLSDVQANWCLIMIPGIIIAGNGQAAFPAVKLTATYAPISRSFCTASIHFSRYMQLWRERQYRVYIVPPPKQSVYKPVCTSLFVLCTLATLSSMRIPISPRSLSRQAQIRQSTSGVRISQCQVIYLRFWILIVSCFVFLGTEPSQALPQIEATPGF